MIAIFDYGAGNLQSVQNALAEVGCEYALVNDAGGLRRATKILLPGVGHFGQMIRAIDALGVRETLRTRLASGAPFLGICLGMQAIFEGSEEAPEARGLGLLAGTVKRFPPESRVPHMGWNELEVRNESVLLRGLPDRPFVYFAHSYYVPDRPDAAACCAYGVRYTAALEIGNLYGVQFHPEKSGSLGLRILRNFLSLEC
jgi:glutamine amidotransferase